MTFSLSRASANVLPPAELPPPLSVLPTPIPDPKPPGVEAADSAASPVGPCEGGPGVTRASAWVGSAVVEAIWRCTPAVLLPFTLPQPETVDDGDTTLLVLVTRLRASSGGLRAYRGVEPRGRVGGRGWG